MGALLDMEYIIAAQAAVIGVLVWELRKASNRAKAAELLVDKVVEECQAIVQYVVRKFAEERMKRIASNVAGYLFVMAAYALPFIYIAVRDGA